MALSENTKMFITAGILLLVSSLLVFVFYDDAKYFLCDTLMPKPLEEPDIDSGEPTREMRVAECAK